MSKVLFYSIFLLYKINCLLLSDEILSNNNTQNETEEDESNEIIIIHTSDVHCGFMDNIGYDGLMLYKKELQKKYKYILTVDTGDHIQGDTIGLLSKGIDVIRIMNKIGYDVVSIGMHEFDYGLDALIECNKTLNCGYINSNFCYRNNKTSIFPQYVIKEIGGKKIAFIGIITPRTLTKTYLSKIMDEDGNMVYDFLTGENGKEFYRTIQKYINEAEADYNIILSYMGDDIDDNLKEFTIGTIIANLYNITAVIDGRSHKINSAITFPDKEGRLIPLSQPGTKLNNIGVIKIKSNGTIIIEKNSKIPKPEDEEGTEMVKRNGIETWIDTEMKEFLINIIDSHSKKLAEIIGSVDFDLIINLDPNDGNNQLTRFEESALGNLITDAIRNSGKGEISLMSAGSIKEDLKMGNISYKNIIDILPFFNDIIVKEVLGQDILDAIEYGVRSLPEKSPKFLQVSGISFKVDITFDSTVEVDNNDLFIKVKGDRRVYDVKVGTEKIDPKRKYLISFDNFIGDGGDGYIMFRKYEEIYNTLDTDNDALISFIQNELNGTIPEYYNRTQGRIIINSNNNDSKTMIAIIIIFFIIIIIVFTIIAICAKKKKEIFKEISSLEIENNANISLVSDI